MNSSTLGVCIGFALTVVPAASHADSASGVFTLPPITISGRVQKPMATVEIARVEPKITLTELRPPFTSRITQALARDPY
jgi:hypothetical protein